MKTNTLKFFFRIGTWCLFLPFMFMGHAHGQFAKGADVSWISEMESSGYVWYNDNGTQEDLLQILKEHGMNTIRLRLWMNPVNGWCDWNDVLYKAKRASDNGFRVMITIHYSDTWADPANQTKPSVWSNLSFEQLMSEVYKYTYNFMVALRNEGVTPEWVQVGNETNNGMLWEDGRASTNMRNYAWLINCGYNAIKAVSSSTKVVVHLSNGWDNALYRWNIGGLISNGAQFDVIGMSIYPTPDNWQTYNSLCLTNMNDMKSRYGKDVMIVEVGMRADYPWTCNSFISDIISKTRSAGGLGVLYWEPQVYNGWKGYGLGAWQENGRPSVALEAFLENTANSFTATNVSSETSVQSGTHPTFKDSWTDWATNESQDGLRNPYKGVKIGIYPNPAVEGLVNIYVDGSKEEVELKVLDLNGKIVSQYMVNASATIINPERLDAGIYIIHATQGNNTRILKLVIE